MRVPGNTSANRPAPDYANLNHWAAHPGKWDFSDSLPGPYRPSVTDTGIDVFFIHPTTYHRQIALDERQLVNPEERMLWNADINDPDINLATDKSPMLYQASAFNAYRVFAPRYRQAHIKTFFSKNDSIAQLIFDLAYEDIRNAFVYFLQYENNGRPFLIASHSQGTLHAARLIREMIDGTPLQENFVAAYIPGLPVRDNFFSGLPVCTEPDRTGCIASWRTFKLGFVPEYVLKETFKAIVVNPLTWTTQPGNVPRAQNKGAVLFKFNKPKVANVGTAIHGNILWSTKPRFFGNLFFIRRNYHVGDINLFWKDIRDNAAQRVEAYRKKRSALRDQ